MIEWRWSLPAMTARDRSAANLAEVLDFSERRRPVHVPRLDVGPATACSDTDVKARLANGGL
jgi:hypothetical protein